MMLLWKSPPGVPVVVAPGHAGGQPSLESGWATSMLGSSLLSCPCRSAWGGLFMVMGHMSSPVLHGHHSQGAQDSTCISHLSGTRWGGTTFLARWDLAPKELDGSFGMDLQTLLAVGSCGLWHPPVAVLPPLLYPPGFWDAVAALGWFALAGPYCDAVEPGLSPSMGQALHLQGLALCHTAHGI